MVSAFTSPKEEMHRKNATVMTVYRTGGSIPHASTNIRHALANVFLLASTNC